MYYCCDILLLLLVGISHSLVGKLPVAGKSKNHLVSVTVCSLARLEYYAPSS